VSARFRCSLAGLCTSYLFVLNCRFGPNTFALVYGDGPVLTVGAACAAGNEHSLDDVLVKDNQGFALNNDGQRAAIVHQYDRCHLNYAPIVENNHVYSLVQLLYRERGAEFNEPEYKTLLQRQPDSNPTWWADQVCSPKLSALPARVCQVALSGCCLSCTGCCL
jgi:hypothetical protein